MINCDRNVLHALMCMHSSDYVSLSDCLHRARRRSSMMRELECGKEWLMILDIGTGISFALNHVQVWMIVLHALMCMNVVVGHLTKGSLLQ